MERLQLVKDWLATFPAPDGEPMGAAGWRVDYTGDVPGDDALLPKGAEELARVKSITGGERVRLRYNFAVYRSFAQDEGWAQAGAKWAAALEDWVAQQNAAGTAPKLGNDSRAGEQVAAGGAALHSVPGDGVALYMVKISFTCGRVYPAPGDK